MSEREPNSGHVLPTNWDHYGLDEIWRMVSEHIDSRNWDQISSWSLMATLCENHADQLRKAAGVLVERWSPAKNFVAAEFMEFVGDIADSMLDAAVAARTNAGALERIMTELLSALVQVRTIKEQRRSTRYVLYTHPFDEQARDVMHRADAAIADARSALIMPPSFVSKWAALPSTRPPPGTPQLAGLPGVPLPPATPPLPRFDVPMRSSPGAFDDSVLVGGPVTLPGRQSSTTPDMGLFDPREEVVPAGGVAPIGGQVARGDAARTLGVYPSFGYVSAPTRGLNTPGPNTGSEATRGSRAIARAAGVPAGGSPMMPMVPPAGRPNPGWASSTSPRGVLRQPSLGAGVVRSGRRQPADPDDPWAVGTGRPAVLEPCPEPEQHDPGPGVIGIDR